MDICANTNVYVLKCNIVLWTYQTHKYKYLYFQVQIDKQVCLSINTTGGYISTSKLFIYSNSIFLCVTSAQNNPHVRLLVGWKVGWLVCMSLIISSKKAGKLDFYASSIYFQFL